MNRPPVMTVRAVDVVPETPPPPEPVRLRARELCALRGEVAGGLLTLSSILGAAQSGQTIKLEALASGMRLLEQAMRRLGVPLGDDMATKAARTLGAFNAGSGVCDCDACSAARGGLQ